MLTTVKHELSQQGLELIKRFEGFRERAYIPVKGDVLTIGYGHTLNAEYYARNNITITKEEAEKLLLSDIQWAQGVVHKYVRLPLTQSQTDALISFVFNIGETQFKRSTLLRELNKGNYHVVDQQLKRWVYSSGIKYRGLELRRRAEAELFEDFAPRFDYTGIMPQSCETCNEKLTLSKTIKDSRKARNGLGIAGIGSIEGVSSALNKVDEVSIKAQDLMSRLSGYITSDLILPALVVAMGIYIIYLQYDDKKRQRAY